MTMFGGGESRGRGGCLKVVIAIVIAGIGLLSYLMKTQVNPVTGEKQHISLSVDQEMALGLQAAPDMAAQMGGAIDPRRDPRAAKVAEVGRKLVQSSDASRSPYVGNFHFFLLADPKTINAFALPGGQIFITAALLDRLENEGQLAGVLGHEIGHVVNRHSAEHMAKGQLGQMLVTAVGVGASDDRGHGQMAAAAAAMANQMLQLKYSRKDELEADAYGLKYMAQSGYAPREMLGVMRILQSASQGGRQPDILATHPDPAARIEQIEQILKRDYPNGAGK